MAEKRQNSSLKEWLVFGGGLIAAILFMWVGIRLLTTNVNFTNTELFLVGCVASFAAVFVMGSQVAHRGKVGGVLLLVGLYYFGRASGTLDRPWLVRVLGAASILAACLLVYTLFPRRHEVTEEN